MRFRAFVLHPTWCRALPSPIKGEGILFNFIMFTLFTPWREEERIG
jgi:hypothetical protein